MDLLKKGNGEKMRITKLILLSFLFISCGDEDGNSNSMSASQFSEELSKLICAQIFLCCDSSERSTFYKTEADCVVDMKKAWDTLAVIDDSSWNGQNAYKVVDETRGLVDSCKRENTFKFILQKYPLTNPTKNAGDKCTTDWECTTKYCLNSVCANVAGAGESCQITKSTDGCADNMVCMSDKKCRPLQTDGAQCAQSYECDSYACSGNKCIRTNTYECDGK